MLLPSVHHGPFEGRTRNLSVFVLKLEVDGGSDLAGNEPVYSIQLHSVHPRAIDAKDDVAYADLSGLVRRRPGNDLAYIDPAAGLLVPNRNSIYLENDAEYKTKAKEKRQLVRGFSHPEPSIRWENIPHKTQADTTLLSADGAHW